MSDYFTACVQFSTPRMVLAVTHGRTTLVRCSNPMGQGSCHEDTTFEVHSSVEPRLKITYKAVQVRMDIATLKLIPHRLQEEESVLPHTFEIGHRY